MKIRTATLDDAAALLAIYEPYVTNSPVSFELEVPNVDEFKGRIAKLLGKFPWLVLEKDGEILGYAYAAPFRERKAYQWSVESTVYVKQGHHRKGVGAALYGKLLELLREQGFVNVIGGITLPNEGSRLLHEQFGYRQVSQYKDAGFKHGRWYDVGYWQLQFEKSEKPQELKPPRSLP